MIALIRLAVSRVLATPNLYAVRLVGTVLAVTLVVGVSLYSTAVGDAMLQAFLANDAYNTTHVSTDYISWGDSIPPLTAEAYQTLDSYVRQQQATDLGLPLSGLFMHHYTARVPLYRTAMRAGQRVPVGSLVAAMPIEYYQSFATQVTVLDGSLDVPAQASTGDAPVAILASTAQALHLRLGDHLEGATRHGVPLTGGMMVAAIYVAKNPTADYWTINNAERFSQSLVLLRVRDFVTMVATGTRLLPEYFWRYTTPLTAIHLDQASTIVAAIQRVRNKVAVIAPNTEVHSWIDQDINGFQYTYGLLPVILYLLVVPIVLLILYAIGVTTALVLDRQAGEIVLIRSRGATRRQVFGMYIIEEILLGGLAILLGPFLGLPLASLIGRASGFLQFQGGLPISIVIAPTIYLFATVTAVLGMLAGLLPALNVARRSMTRYKQEQARLGGRPFWQRIYLDVILLGIALYGYSVLTRQGAITSGAGMAAITQDPLIGLTPLLFALSLTLVISRFLPQIASVGTFIASRFSSPSVQVALQSISRAPRQPMLLVQLVGLTLSLGVFAATVAGVEDSNVRDQYLYQAGTTLRLDEQSYGVVKGKYVPLAMPVAWHLALPGVHAASPALRFASYGDIVNQTDNNLTVNVLGVDPTTAARVMWFRADFSSETFGQLLHHIATAGPSAIVSTSFVQQTGLHRGDSVSITLSNNHVVHCIIAAIATYFPTLDPSETGNPFVVTNLSYLVAASHSPGPNEMWLKTDNSSAAVAAVVRVAHERPSSLGTILDYSGIKPAFFAANNPLQAGIYGVVSLGFLIAGVLSLLGFVAYAYISLQRRMTEFAIVRALGLAAGQLRWLLLFEQFFLLGAGILGGIVTGVLTSVLFLPYLPIVQSIMPPFVVAIPWYNVDEFVIAVLIVFVFILSTHVSILTRVNLGRVLRLGDA